VRRNCVELQKSGVCKPYKNGIECFCGKPMCNDEQFDSRVLGEYDALDSAASSGDSPGDSPRNGSQPSDESGGGGSKSASSVMTVDMVIFCSSLFFAQLL